MGYYSNSKQNKIKWHCKDSTFHVKKQKHRFNQNWPIIVEQERWDANRGISKLRCLIILEILIRDALGIPKLELLCPLNSFHIAVSLNLKNFIHTKLNKNSWDKLAIICHCIRNASAYLILISLNRIIKEENICKQCKHNSNLSKQESL